MDAEQEGSASWTCVNALFEMFFSNRNNYSSNKISREDIRSLIAKHLSGSKTTNARLCHQDNVLIGEKVNALLEIEPRLKFKRAMSRISWYRFGFRAQLHKAVLSNSFIKDFGNWRLMLSLTGKSHTVCDLGSGIDKTPTLPITIANTAFKGYTIDRFFHCADRIRLFSDKIDWQLVRTELVGAHVIKSTSKTSSPKRPVKNTVGANSYIAIEKCIAIAAKDEKFLWIQDKKVGDRYPSTVTRDELAELLLGKFSSILTCSKSVIKRALSDFVSGPKARRRALA